MSTNNSNKKPKIWKPAIRERDRDPMSYQFRGKFFRQVVDMFVVECRWQLSLGLKSSSIYYWSFDNFAFFGRGFDTLKSYTCMRGSYQFHLGKLLIQHTFLSFLFLKDLKGPYAQHNSSLGWYHRELAFLSCGLGLITNPFVTCALRLQWLLFAHSHKVFSL